MVEPLRPFSNVVIERRFLTQQEIARLHKDYGAFLCPSRMDTQGVSRDEAMASGLVPITNAVAAIPEFVSDQEGLLAPGEDSSALAQGIRRLAQDPQLFKRLSENAALRVRQQSGKRQVIEQELSLFVIATPKATLANDKPME